MTYPGAVAPPVSAAEAPTGTLDGIARRARAAAAASDRALPVLGAGGHLRDAAGAIGAGRHEAAKRHLRAAMQLYGPVSLARHGVTDDDGHALARQHLAAAHRLHLQVQEHEAGR